MEGRWQLLGRPAEQQFIRSALLRSGDRCGVVVVGPAGVGKTTLARMVTDSLGRSVRWAACTESSRAIPLGAFAPWVAPTASRDPIAALVSARETLVAEPGTVIGIDDAHMLDQLSATLLHQIAIDRSARIIATVRTGEPVPDAVTSLWKDGYLHRLELQNLTKEQCAELVERVLGGSLEGLSADVIWDSSGGNPLFLRNMIEGAIESDALSEVSGVWQLRGPTAVPSGLVALLDDRLDRAGPQVVDALKVLSLYEPIDIDLLIGLVGEEPVDEAETIGLIKTTRDGNTTNVRFAHPLYGDVVRRRISTIAARRLRAELVDALRDHATDTAAERIRLAQLSVDAHRDVDTSLLIAAAKDAIFLANLPLGERLARVAYEHDGSLTAGELLSRAIMWQGRVVEADGVFTEFDPESFNEFELVVWAVSRMSLIFWMLGDVDESHRMLELLNEKVEHPTLRLVVDAVAAAMAVHENRIDEGIALAEHVLESSNAPSQAIDFAAFGAGLAMSIAGRGRDYAPYAERTRAKKKATDGMISVMVRYCDVLALTMVGDLKEARNRATEYTQFSSSGQFLGWAIAKIAAGVAATYSGSFREAISEFEQALAALNAKQPLPWRLPGRLILVRAYAALNDVDEAERVLRDADEHRGPHLAIHDSQRVLAQAWISAAQGAERAAIDHAHDAAAIAHDSGQLALEAESLHHATRFGDKTTAPRLAELATLIQGDLGHVYARHAAALAASDPDELAAASHDFEDAGLLLSAADAAAQAAQLYDRAKRRGDATACSARVLALSKACDGATTPAIRATARPLPITSREREIAVLIGRGLTNREIAERLTVSVRTVEGHIYRACIKLDVADRDSLAGVVNDAQVG